MQINSLSDLRKAVEADTEGRWNALGVLDAVERLTSATPPDELSGNPGELIDKMADAIRGDTVLDDTPWEMLSEDRKIGWRGDAERALAVVKEYLTDRRPAEQAVTEEWREIKQHVQPRIADGYTAVAISKPGYWFVKGPGPAAAIRSLKGGHDAQ